MSSLSELARQVRDGRSATELVQMSLSLIERERHLGAVIAVSRDSALAEAARVDAAVSSGQKLPVLAGIPMLVKDSEDVAGLRTTFGSKIFADSKPASGDSVVVGRLRAAGAIVVGKTNVPEFCIEGYCSNPLFGSTHNPWNEDFSPGGSSGGSAAALSAGLVPLATGTDGAGSVRIPAAFCGLVGFKPTNGSIGRGKLPDWVDFSTPGFMSGYTEDLSLLLNIVAGPVLGDPTALPVPIPDSPPPTRIVAAVRTEGTAPIDADVHKHFVDAVERFSSSLGLPVSWQSPSDFFSDSSPDGDWYTIAAAEHAANLEMLTGPLPEDLHPGTKSFLEFGRNVSLREYLAARKRRFAQTKVMDQHLNGGTVLLTPTVPVPGWGVSGDVEQFPGMVVPADRYSSSIQNLTGMPALSLPAGLLPNGLPFGLQVTGSRWSDRALIELARRWEAAQPWPVTAPGYVPFGE